MKYSSKLLLVSVFTVFMVFGCSDYLDINDDPNNPTSAPLQGLMTNTTFETARNTNRVAGTTSFFVQHFASPNEATSTDIHESVSYGGTWSSLYFTLGDLLVLTQQAEDTDAPYYAGIAKIMTAYNLSLLVNMFGDVPYSDGFSADETLQPTYDSSEQIYNEMFSLLSEGITDLQASESAASPGNDDFIFNGDRAAWIRTAYALRARFLNHYSKLGSYDPAAVLEAVDNAFASNDEDFQMTYFGEVGIERNPWHILAVNNAGLLLGGWLSDQFVDHLSGETHGIEDPRLDFITDPASNEDFPELIGEYIGTRNGAGRGDAPEQGVRAVLSVDSWYADTPTRELLMATYAEMKFIEAEAALGTNPGRAYTAFRDGIRAHMEKLGVDEGDIDDYLNSPEVAVGAATLSIDDIMREKYVAMFLTPEAWNDARRYDYSYQGFEAPANSALGGEMIRLVRYPDSELQRNSANVPNRTMLDRVFWDQN